MSCRAEWKSSRRHVVFSKMRSVKVPAGESEGRLHLTGIGLLFLLATLSFAGCAPAGSTKMVGTWKLDGADELENVMNKAPKPTGVMGDLMEAVKSRVKNEVAASMTLEFLSGGKLKTTGVFMGANQVKEGTWKWVRSDGASEVIWCQLGQDDPVEVSVSFVDSNTIELVPPNIAVLNRKLKFKREVKGS